MVLKRSPSTKLLSFNDSSPTHLQLANVKPLALCLCSTAIQYLPVDVSLTTRRSLRCINGEANTVFIVPCTRWLRGCWLQGLLGSLHCKWYLCHTWVCLAVCGVIGCDNNPCSVAGRQADAKILLSTTLWSLLYGPQGGHGPAITLLKPEKVKR